MKTATKLKIVAFVEKVLGLKRICHKHARRVSVSKTYFLHDFNSKEAEHFLRHDLASELDFEDHIDYSIESDTYSDVDTVTVKATVFVV